MKDSWEGPGRSAKLGLLETALFIAVFAAFYWSPVQQIWDSKYSMLLSQTMLQRHSVDLKYAHLKIADSPDPEKAYPYQTILTNGRLLYYLPWGGSILSIPVVAVLNAAGISTIGPNGRYNLDGDARIQRIVAPMLMAAMIWLVFRIAMMASLPVPWALAIAVGTAFGTQVWSTTSRAVWSQTWLLLLLSLVIWMLLRCEVGKGRFRPILTATLLSWMYFVRPTASTPIMAISVYVLVTYPRAVPAYVATGLAWGAGFVGCSLHFFGTVLPPYYRMTWFFSSAQMRHRLIGLLLSPSRGLLIYVPVVIFVLYLVARYWKELKHKGLATVALAVIAADLMLVSMLLLWWGGWSYGPRELTDTVPFFVLLAILGCRAFLDDTSLHLHGAAATIAVGLSLLALSIVMNAPGALSNAASAWNGWVDPKEHPECLWDWSHAQFLAPLNAAVSQDALDESNDLQIGLLKWRAQPDLAAQGQLPPPPDSGAQPVIESVNGTPVIANVGPHGGSWAPTVILARNHNPLLSWWDADTSEPIVLGGRGFDVHNGVAVGLFCACPDGQIGPFFFNPGNPGFSATRIILRIPRSGSGAPPAGMGLLVVRNRAADGTYLRASNEVWVEIGAPIHVRHVYQSGAMLTVKGAGFSTATVLDLYCGRPVVNVGGMDAAKRPRIPFKLDSDSLLRFKVPAEARPGRCYLEASNPPFLPFSSSHGDRGGGFVLR